MEPSASTMPDNVPDEMGARDTHPPGGGRFDEAGDATRRTRLANERTYLAWWRTGLTAFAVSLGAGKLVPALTDETRWPYVVVGVGFALLGVAFVAYGFRRQRLVERAVTRGEYVRPDERLLAWLTVIGILLGFMLLVIVVIED
jgi:putative membrane protein